MKAKIKIGILIFAHLLVLGGLYTWRTSLAETIQNRELFNQKKFQGDPLDYLQLYLSIPWDELYYYEWSSLALGHDLRAAFPFQHHRIYHPNCPLIPLLEEAPRPRLPYRDIAFEYPPLMLIPLLGSRLLSSDYVGFARIFAWVMSLAYLASLWIAYRLWKKIPESQRLSLDKLLLLSLACMVALGNLVVTRLDAIPSLLTLLALYAGVQHQWTRAALWTVLGFLAKGYPILLAPLFGILLLQRKNYRGLLIYSLLVIFLLGAINLGLGHLTEGRYWDSFRYHSLRGIQIESLYALVPYWGHLLFHIPIKIYASHSSINIWMHHAGLPLLVGQWLSLLLLAGLYLLYWNSLRKSSDREDNPQFHLQLALLLIYALILGSKVFSPQFTLWLLPLIFLMSPPRRGMFFSLFLAVLILTQLIFPIFYHLLETAAPAGIFLLSVRNLGHLVLFLWLLIDWKRKFLDRPAF